jgi:hypothetical protein
MRAGISQTSGHRQVITLGCIQSCYIPWRGYFDIIRQSDIFVFQDAVQYTKQDWRNRNLIKTPAGSIWLTIPVKNDTIAGPIDAVVIDQGQAWGARHWRQIEANYRQAPCFGEVSPVLKDLLMSAEPNLSAFNIRIIREICAMLCIGTQMITSRSLGLLEGRKTDQLISMCKAVGAKRYLSGPSARNYIETGKFLANGIELVYMDYQYPAYPQQFQGFLGNMSIIDLLLNCGPQCHRYFGGGGSEQSRKR